jgi:hypothetical protein
MTAWSSIIKKERSGCYNLLLFKRVNINLPIVSFGTGGWRLLWVSPFILFPIVQNVVKLIGNNLVYSTEVLDKHHEFLAALCSL